MAKFILSYDLIKQKDYPKLWAELERLGGKRILFSMWSLDLTTDSAVAVRDHFRAFVDADDRVFVSQLSPWASWNALNKPV